MLTKPGRVPPPAIPINPMNATIRKMYEVDGMTIEAISLELKLSPSHVRDVVRGLI